METTEKKLPEVLAETYQQYQTAQQCEQKIQDNDQKTQELQQTLENLEKRNITSGVDGISQAITALQAENNNIQKLLAYFQRKRTQIHAWEKKESELSTTQATLNPADSETTKERITTRETKMKIEKRAGKYTQLLHATDTNHIHGPFFETQQSLRDIIEAFYDQEIGQKREKDEELGLIPTETEKMLMKFFAQQEAQQPEKSSDGTLKKFHLSKEYRTLKKQYNEMIKDIKNPVILAFAETEFTKITQVSDPQEQQDWLNALSIFISNEKSYKNPSQKWQSYLGNITYILETYSSRSSRKKDKNLIPLLKNENAFYSQQSKTLELHQRYQSLVSASPEWVVPSHAIICLLQEGKLEKFGFSLDNEKILQELRWNELGGYWNFAELKDNSIKSNLIYSISDNHKNELQQIIIEKIKNIVRELLPAINAIAAIKKAYGDNNFRGYHLIDRAYGLRSSTTQNYIESTLKGSDAINLISQITFNTAKKTIQEQEERESNLLEALGKPESNEGLLATIGNIIDKLIKKYNLIAPDFPLDNNLTHQKKQYEDCQASLTKVIQKAQDLKNRMEQKKAERENIGWWKRQQHKGKVELSYIQRDLENIQEEINTLRKSTTNWLLGQNSKFTIKLDVPKTNASIETIEIILKSSNAFFEEQIGQLTQQIQKKETESAELFTQYQKISSECTQIINELKTIERNKNEKNCSHELNTSFNRTVNRLDHYHTFFNEITKKQEEKVDTEPEPR